MEIPFDQDVYEKILQGNLARHTGCTEGFAFDLDFSTPAIATAVHAGHSIRKELGPQLAISEEKRRFEEDAATDQIIQDLPSTLWGLDSRAEYDLNRPPHMAVPVSPDMFWGERVYTGPLGQDMVNRSMKKYEAFYRFMGTCVKILLERFGGCVIYDIHSYNISRQLEKGIAAPPVFNVGTLGIDRGKWRKAIDSWVCRLGEIQIPGVDMAVAENEVFKGRAEFCRRVSGWDPNILVLPTEISKVYMDERKGRIKEKIVRRLRKGLKEAVSAHTKGFDPSGR